MRPSHEIRLGQAKQYSHSPACRLRSRNLFKSSDADKHRVDEADHGQNRWLAEQVQEADVPAKGGDEGLPQAGTPPQNPQPPPDVDRSSGMYEPSGPGGGENDDLMDAFTDDMNQERRHDPQGC